MTHRILLLLFTLVCTISGFQIQGARNYIVLRGYLVESLANTPLKGARVALLDSAYNEVDTTRSGTYGQRWTLAPGQLPPAEFRLRLPKQSGKYYIAVEYPGYDDLVSPYELKRFGSESSREAGTLVMNRAPKQLKEIVVTASKVKFYHSGDTLVYNADAFQLADGSMLDVLINQLPGVELNDAGQIYVNGRFVESLLLDGKEFFKGNNRLMLQNLGAYMVKDVAVYEKASDRSELIGKSAGDDMFVMDVRLKKEYQVGWILNVEPGIGTDGRYMGRFFGLGYTPTLRIGSFANFNNLNDNQRPNENNTFKAQVTGGINSEKQAGININYSSVDKRNTINGIVSWTGSDITDNRQSTRLLFLPSGNNHQYAYTDGNMRNDRFMMYISGNMKRTYHVSNLSLNAEYSRDRSSGDMTSATFLSEQSSMTRDIIRGLYTDISPVTTESIVNRVLSTSRRRGRNLEGTLFYSELIKVPYSDYTMQLTVEGKAGERRNRSFNGYLVNAGSDPVPTHDEGQWTDTRPNRNYSIRGVAKFTSLAIPGVMEIIPSYNYKYTHTTDNLETMIENSLADMGVYGVMAPPGAAYSPNDSYYSTLATNHHSLSLYISGAIWKIYFMGEVSGNIETGNLNYLRGDQTYTKHRSTIIPGVKNFSLRYEWGQVANRYGPIAKNQLFLRYDLNGKTPNLLWLLPVVDDTDPMNIYVGAENLKNQLSHSVKLTWNLRTNQNLTHGLDIGYMPTSDALVRGYVYDRATGVRTIRSYNTTGNWLVSVASRLAMQFGPRKVLSLSNDATGNLSHASDMIGTVAGEIPPQSTVSNTMFTDRTKFSWQIGRQNIGVMSDLTWRRTKSESRMFTDFTATSWTYGVTGVFNLPANIQLSTDLSIYNRWGAAYYGNDRRDIVWNARVSYSPLKNLTFMIDGFDLLHQLNNVIYDVNAQGRTVTYTNVIPRYMLFHVLYRLNVQPKARRK